MSKANPMAKDNPEGYWQTSGYGWTYVLRKLYKSPANSLKDPYARALIAVRSPMTYGRFDIGDTYVNEVPGLPQWLQTIANQIEENKGAPQ